MIATGFAPVLSIKHSLFIFLVVFFQAVGAQTDSTGMVKFTPDFKFEDGIFVNFDQVRQNSPIPKSRVITTVAYDEPDFFERVLQEKRIALYDNLGTRQEISTKNLWGFSRNGVLYINLNEGYYRITIIRGIIILTIIMAIPITIIIPIITLIIPRIQAPRILKCDSICSILKPGMYWIMRLKAWNSC